MAVIGVSGRIGAGKNTFADLFVQQCPQFVQKSFAYKVKQIASLLLGLPIKFIDSREGKDHFLQDYQMTVRVFLQKLATDALRDRVHSNIWIYALFADYKEGDNWIITDLRFPNEIEYMKDKGGIFVRMNGNPTNLPRNDHYSETALDDYKDWDVVIDNTKGLDFLKDQVTLFKTSLKLAR